MDNTNREKQQATLADIFLTVGSSLYNCSVPGPTTFVEEYNSHESRRSSSRSRNLRHGRIGSACYLPLRGDQPSGCSFRDADSDLQPERL